MSKKEITILTDVSLITCVVQRGKADDIIKAAQEVGAQGATAFYARGGGIRERLGVLGLAIEVEKEIINILVANDQIDRIFEKMFIAGQLDTPGMGIMWRPIPRSSRSMSLHLATRIHRSAGDEQSGADCGPEPETSPLPRQWLRGALTELR